MRTLAAVIAVAAFAGVLGDCPNSCSGHGNCVSNNDYCECYSGWLGADCSDRICPFGLSYIDTPNGDFDHDNELGSGGGDSAAATFPADVTSGSLNPQFRSKGWWERHPSQLYGSADQVAALPAAVRLQEGHFYAECSNRGLCNRASGECDCFMGYEGSACNRTACPNDCSGHGVCTTIRESTPDEFYYLLWDADSTRMCTCDGGWGGIDCSMRLCMKNDDPLTTTTTTVEMNDGLAEQNEEQIIEFRCPYNGKILSDPEPKISLTYTDVQFGDSYTTAQFNPIDSTEANIAAALKALPNQVLSDYDVENSDPTRELVLGVTRETIEDDRFYRLTVTFDSSIGNVPLLGATAHFRCQGGAEVDTSSYAATTPENVKASYTGDGPSEDLIFEFTWTDGSTYDYVVKNSAGEELADPVTGVAAGALTDIANFGEEAEKVSFEWGGAATLAARSGNTATVQIHTTPIISVRNSQYTLAASADQALTEGLGDTITVNARTTAWDAKSELVSTAASGVHRIWSLTIDGEFRGYISALTTSSKAAQFWDFAEFPNTIPTAYEHTFEAAGPGTNGDSVTHFREKTAVVSTNTHGVADAITITFADNEAPARELALVFKICDTASSPDTFTWKLAGDGVYASDVAGSTGCTTMATTGALPNVAAYVAHYNGDDEGRDALNQVQVSFAGGADLDARSCTTDSRYYYAQIGSVGLNDFAECSDRGMCDYATGQCSCFKGYAGIDCSEQHALAMGSSIGGSSSGL